jgi:hypothetical protein
MMELRLIRISQFCHLRYKRKTHQHYNYLQSILNQKLFTKDIKNAEQQGLGLVDQTSTDRRGGVQWFEGKL